MEMERQKYLFGKYYKFISSKNRAFIVIFEKLDNKDII